MVCVESPVDAICDNDRPDTVVPQMLNVFVTVL